MIFAHKSSSTGD